MNRIVRLLAASALLGAAGPVPAQAWQPADPALIDLAPQRYAVPDVPRDIASDVPPDAGVGASDPDPSPGMRYDLLLLDGSAMVGYGYRPDGTRLRWFGGPADAVAGPGGLGPLASGGLDTWSLGAHNWRYRSSAGYRVTLGNTGSGAPDWGRSVRLAGVGVSRSVPSGRLQAGSWDYAVAAGALDGTAGRAAAAGDLAYGPMGVDAATRYALDRDLTLGSRLQSAQDMTALGLGGEYAMGGAGAWQFGASRSRQALAEGWRRHLGYTLGLVPGLDLSWVNARQGPGYADLATYGGDAGCDCVSNQWQIDWAAGRWGSISGSFERRVDAGGGLDERVGLTHGFRYGPYLRVRLETNRNLSSGDYGLGARFSLPLD
ncbi:hypothetical protein ACFO0J_06605 [Castellaniella hirudinis]|uniref:Uncharacterized protein n=1 Tax=Castellaniella hirudinis TaxID=1144617 RepID=A0ABV8RX32_9BURK